MVVGVCGKKRSGKDTVGGYLVEAYNFIPYSFAWSIKESCKVIFDWDDERISGSEKEVVDPRWGISPRQAMQHLGTEWGQFGLNEAFPEFKRVTGRNLWAHSFYYWVMMTGGSTRNIIVTDLRFPHEADVIRRKLDGIVIRVVRDEADAVVDLHPSEQEMMKILPDIILDNNGTIGHLYDGVDAIVKEWERIK